MSLLDKGKTMASFVRNAGILLDSRCLTKVIGFATNYVGTHRPCEIKQSSTDFQI